MANMNSLEAIRIGYSHPKQNQHGMNLLVPTGSAVNYQSNEKTL